MTFGDDFEISNKVLVLECYNEFEGYDKNTKGTNLGPRIKEAFLGDKCPNKCPKCCQRMTTDYENNIQFESAKYARVYGSYCEECYAFNLQNENLKAYILQNSEKYGYKYHHFRLDERVHQLIKKYGALEVKNACWYILLEDKNGEKNLFAIVDNEKYVAYTRALDSLIVVRND